MFTFSIHAQELQKGGIVINTNVNEHFLIIDGDIENAIEITNEDTVWLDPGMHEFIVSSKLKNDYTFETEIYADSVYTFRINLYSGAYDPELSLYPSIFWDANLFILANEHAKVFIDDQEFEKGDTGLAKELNEGVYEIRIVNGKYSKSKSVKIAPNQIESLTLTTLPKRHFALLFSVLPGVSQFYKEQQLKGLGFISGILSTTALSYYLNERYLDSNNDYLRNKDLYFESTDPVLINEYAIKAQQSLDNANKFAKLRDNAILAIGVVYALNIVDGIISEPKRGYFQRINFDPYYNFETNYPSSIGIKVAWDLE